VPRVCSTPINKRDVDARVSPPSALPLHTFSCDDGLSQHDADRDALLLAEAAARKRALGDVYVLLSYNNGHCQLDTAGYQAGVTALADTNGECIALVALAQAFAGVLLLCACGRCVISRTCRRARPLLLARHA
jgi:hypothetical protein